MTAFFNSNTVQAAAPVRAGTRRSSAAWVQLGRVDAVECERLSTTVVRRDIFDRLEERGIVRGGSIARCMDVPCGEMVIASDLLRLMLLDEGSEVRCTHARKGCAMRALGTHTTVCAGVGHVQRRREARAHLPPLPDPSRRWRPQPVGGRHCSVH